MQDQRLRGVQRQHMLCGALSASSTSNTALLAHIVDGRIMNREAVVDCLTQADALREELALMLKDVPGGEFRNMSITWNEVLLKDCTKEALIDCIKFLTERNEVLRKERRERAMAGIINRPEDYGCNPLALSQMPDISTLVRPSGG